MRRFALTRLGQAGVTVLATTALIHAATFVLPGDPIRALFGLRRPPAEVLMQLRAVYRLDDPWPIQYGWYLRNLLRGDLGPLFTGGRVADVIVGAAPTTMRLLSLTLALQLGVGLFLGVRSAGRRGSWEDHAVSVLPVVGIAIPVFVLAQLTQVVLGRWLSLAPAGGFHGGWPGVILGALCLALVPISLVARVVRIGVRDALGADYTRLATAKGLTRERVLWIHALRGAAVPVVALIGAEFGALLTGTVFVEAAFRLPGLGGSLLLGIRNREGPLVVGIITVFVLSVVVVSAVVDVLTAVVDRRVASMTGLTAR